MDYVSTHLYNKTLKYSACMSSRIATLQMNPVVVSPTHVDSMGRPHTNTMLIKCHENPNVF